LANEGKGHERLSREDGWDGLEIAGEKLIVRICEKRKIGEGRAGSSNHDFS